MPSIVDASLKLFLSHLDDHSWQDKSLVAAREQIFFVNRLLDKYGGFLNAAAENPGVFSDAEVSAARAAYDKVRKAYVDVAGSVYHSYEHYLNLNVTNPKLSQEEANIALAVRKSYDLDLAASLTATGRTEISGYNVPALLVDDVFSSDITAVEKDAKRSQISYSVLPDKNVSLERDKNIADAVHALLSKKGLSGQRLFSIDYARYTGTASNVLEAKIEREIAAKQFFDETWYDILGEYSPKSYEYRNSLAEVHKLIYDAKFKMLSNALSEIPALAGFEFDESFATARSGKVVREFGTNEIILDANKRPVKELGPEARYNELIRQVSEYPYGESLRLAVGQMKFAHKTLFGDDVAKYNELFGYKGSTVRDYAKQTGQVRYGNLRKEVAKGVAALLFSDKYNGLITTDPLFNFSSLLDNFQISWVRKDEAGKLSLSDSEMAGRTFDDWFDKERKRLDENVRLLQQYEGDLRSALNDIGIDKPDTAMSVKEKVRYYQNAIQKAVKKKGKLDPKKLGHQRLVATLPQHLTKDVTSVRTFFDAYVDSLDISDEEKSAIKRSGMSFKKLLEKTYRKGAKAGASDKNATDEQKKAADEQKKAAQKIARNVVSDEKVIKGYEELATAQGLSEKPVGTKRKDIIDFYRSKFKDRLDTLLADNALLSNAGVLDLVAAAEEKGKPLSDRYKSVAARLATSLGLWDQKRDDYLERKVPLFVWADKKAEIDKYKAKQRAELFAAPDHDSFVTMMSEKGYRNSLETEEVTGTDGKVHRIKKGVTWLEDTPYRVTVDRETGAVSGVDTAAYKAKLDNILKPYRDRAVAARKSWVSRRVKALQDKQAKLPTASSRTENDNKVYAGWQEKIEKLQAKGAEDPTAGILDRVKGLTAQKGVFEAVADEEELTDKILEQDVFFDLRNVKDYKAALEKVKEDKAFVTAPALAGQGYEAPTSWLGKSVAEQRKLWEQGLALAAEIKSESRDAFEKRLDSVGLPALLRQLPKGVLRTYHDAVYRLGVDQPGIFSLLDRKREAAVAAPRKKADTPVSLNSYGRLLLSRRQQLTADDLIAINKTLSATSLDEFDRAYSGMLKDQRAFYDRNYGQPLEHNGRYYRTMYDMPDDVWQEFEESRNHVQAADRGFAKPSYDVIAEQQLQDEISAKLAQEKWEPIAAKPKERPVAEEKPKDPAEPDKPATTEDQKEKPADTKTEKTETKTKPVIKPNVDNLLSELDRDAAARAAANQKEVRGILAQMMNSHRSRSNTIGTMGVISAMALFNLATSGPSKEALEHRRRVEEQRRIAMYGY